MNREGNNYNNQSAGRGRGRGRRAGEPHFFLFTSNNILVEDGTEGDADQEGSGWNNSHRREQEPLWDAVDSKKSQAFELADFAAASLKFRSEMKSMSIEELSGGQPLEENEEDTMEGLLRQQIRDQFDADDNGLLVVDGEEEEDDVPLWAVHIVDRLATNIFTFCLD